MVKCVEQSESVIKLFQNIQFMNIGADSVQFWSFGTKIILLTSACAFIWQLTSDIT